MLDFNNAADEFLRVMAPDEDILFVTLPDDGGAGKGGVKQVLGKWDDLKRLLHSNNGRPRHGVFWTVNSTKGDRRRAEDITHVRAFFIDLDGPKNGSIDAVLAHPIRPHAIVSTSPGKYHVYWKVFGCPQYRFEPIQKSLIAKFNSDTACADISRLMRVPGTLNNKKSPPTEVQLIQLNDLPAYNAKWFYDNMGLECSQEDMDKEIRRLNPVAKAFTAESQNNLDSFNTLISNLKMMGRLLETRKKGYDILCPWSHLHSHGGRQDESSMLLLPTESTNWRGGYSCMHNACKGKNAKTIADVTDWVTEQITGEKE